jgi:hypothetical protein
MGDSFELSAIISASTERFNSAMSAAADMASASFAKIRSAFSEGAEASTASMNQMAEASESASHQISEQFDSIKESAMRLIEVMGAFEAARWFKEGISSALEFGEQMTNMSVATGLSVQHLQELKFASDTVGVSFERVEQAVGQMSRALVSLQSGSARTYEYVLKLTHLKASDLADPYEAFQKVSEAIHRMGEASAQSRELMVTLFGRAGLEMLPLMDKFDELTHKANEMGAVVSNKVVAQLNAADEAFNQLGAIIRADGERIAAAFTPVLEAAAGMATQLAQKLGQLASDGRLQAFAVAASDQLINLAEAFVEDASEAADFISKLEAMYKFGLELSPAYWIYKGVKSAADGLSNLNHILDAVPQHAASAADATKARLEELRAKIHQLANQPTTVAGDNSNNVNLNLGGAGGSKDMSRTFAQQAAQIARWQEQQRQAQAQSITDAAAAAADKLKIQQAELSAELAAHKITNVAELQAAQQLAAQLHAIHEQQYAQLEALYQGDAAKLRSVLAQKERMETADTIKSIQLAGELAAAQQEAAKRAQEAQQKAAEQAAKAWQHAFSQIADFASRSFDILLSGARNTSQQFERLLGSMLESLIKSALLGALEGGPAGTLSNRIFGGGLEGLLGLGGGAHAQQQSSLMLHAATKLPTAFQDIVNAAKNLPQMFESLLNATGPLSSGFQSLLSSITSMFGGSGMGSMLASLGSDAMSALSLFGFADGGIVPSAAAGMIVDSSIATGAGRGILAQVHPREMILPSHLSDGIQNLISSGGGHTVNIHHAPTINAIDAKGVKEVLSRHSDHIADLVMDSLHGRGRIYGKKR